MKKDVASRECRYRNVCKTLGNICLSFQKNGSYISSIDDGKNLLYDGLIRLVKICHLFGKDNVEILSIDDPYYNYVTKTIEDGGGCEIL
jgi:hypothetical protein